MRIQSVQEHHFSFPDIDGFWNIQNLNETENRIRMTLPEAESAYSPNQIENLTQLIRVLCLQNKIKEAHALIDIAQIQINNLSKLDSIRPAIRLHLEQGRMFGLSMSATRALEAFGAAWTLAKDSQYQVFAVDAAYMISITLPPKERKKWLLKAANLAEESNNDLCKSWLPHIYMLAGWQSFDSHDYLNAYTNFAKAEKISDQQASSKICKNIKWSLARSLRALGKNIEALAIQEKIISDLDILGQTNGHVYLELAECHQALHNTEKARSYYELAYEHLKKDNWYTDNHDHELSRIQKNSKK